MAQGTLNLHIGSTFSGKGFQQLETALAASGARASRASTAVNAVSSAVGGLGGNVGKLLGLGRILMGGLLSTGVWMAVGAAISFVVGKVTELWRAYKDLQEARKPMSLSERKRMNEGYERRLELYKKQAAERAAAAAAEKRAAAEKAAADKKYGDEQQIKWQTYYQEQLDAEREITAERERRNLVAKEGIELARAEAEIRIKDAQRNTASKQAIYNVQSQHGTPEGAEKALLDLRLAQEKEKTVIAEERQKIIKMIKAREDEERAVELAASAAEEEAEQREKIRKIREKIANDQKAAHDKAKRIDEEINRKRLEAAEWKTQANGAKGKDFNSWDREQKRAAREQERAARRDQKQWDAAKSEYDRIWARTHDRNGNVLKSASKADLDRLARLDEWRKLRNPNNDPAKKAEQLEKEKRDLLKKAADEAEKTRKALENIGL